MKPVGDEALNELVIEELQRNHDEERERFEQSKNASNWFGKFLPNNPFNYEIKSEYDFYFMEVRDFVAQKIETMTREDKKFNEVCSVSDDLDKKVVVELSLCSDDNDIDENKLYGEDICGLTGASKVAILRAYMLNK